MKKKVTVLVAIYILFFLLGLWFNHQRGVADYDQFWKLKQDGWFTSPAGDRIRYSSTSGFDLVLNDHGTVTEDIVLPFQMDGHWKQLIFPIWLLRLAAYGFHMILSMS